MSGSHVRGSFNLSGLKRRLAAIVVAALVAVPAVLAVPALAQTVSFSFTGADFSVPRPADQTDQEGVRRLLTTFDLAANGFGDLIGRTCTFTVEAANGQSVHPNNFGVIATGANETDVLQTETLPNVVETVLQDATLVLGATIELYNVMLPDANGIVATSVVYTVIVTCTAQQTTTTTPETTTTTSETTTTTSETTTTSSTTTTSTSTTSTTSTTDPETTTTTIPITTTSISATTLVQPTLPFTGPGGGGWVSLAAALLVAGAVALGAARRRSDDTAPDKPFSSG